MVDSDKRRAQKIMAPEREEAFTRDHVSWGPASIAPHRNSEKDISWHIMGIAPPPHDTLVPPKTYRPKLPQAQSEAAFYNAHKQSLQSRALRCRRLQASKVADPARNETHKVPPSNHNES